MMQMLPEIQQHTLEKRKKLQLFHHTNAEIQSILLGDCICCPTKSGDITREKSLLFSMAVILKAPWRSVYGIVDGDMCTCLKAPLSRHAQKFTRR